MKKITNIFTLILLLIFTGTAYSGDGDYENGLRYFRMKNYKKAVNILEKYVTVQPDPSAYYMLGYSYYKLKVFDKASKYFEETYLIDPSFTSEKIAVHSEKLLPDTKLIDEVLELSGAKKQLGYVSEIVAKNIPALKTGLNEEKFRQELTRIIKESYGVEKLYFSVVDIFKKRYNREHLKDVAIWLRSSIGQKMTMAELSSSSPDAVKKAELFKEEYKNMNEKRKELILKMGMVLRAVDLDIELMAVSFEEITKGMFSGLETKKKLDLEQIKGLANKIRNAPREQVALDVLISMAYTYRELSDEELEKVISFYERPSGRWFVNSSFESIISAFGKASREAGEKIGRFIALKDLSI